MKNLSEVDTVWPSGFRIPSFQHSGRPAPDTSYARYQYSRTLTSPPASWWPSSNGRMKFTQSMICGQAVPVRRQRIVPYDAPRSKLNDDTLVRATHRVDVTIQTTLDRATKDILAWDNHLTWHAEATVGAEDRERAEQRERLLCAQAGKHPAAVLAEHAAHLGLCVDARSEIVLLDALQRIGQDLTVVAVVGVGLLALHKPIRWLGGVDTRESVAIMTPGATGAISLLEDSKRVGTGRSELGCSSKASKAGANDDDLGLSGQGGGKVERGV
eukprot:3172039-Prymnesium_polylepis.1